MGSKNKWGYEFRILNYKAREVIGKTIQKLKSYADLAGVKIDTVSIATIYTDLQELKFELKFWHNEKLYSFSSIDLDNFENKFVEFLGSAKRD